MFHVVLAQADLPFLVSLHRTVGWYVVGILGIVGLWGVALGVARRDPGRAFWIGAGFAFAVGVLQVAMGLIGFAVEERDPGNQHLFYGVVMMFAFSFAYMYRSQFSRRPALSYGLLFLFCMGLGIRGIMTFGQSFGA
ncbi:MAG TPA: hypothetical protein VLB67_14800 [Acidimicrobiia bacterium]|nr:hypothetical protein [Acidimicrobiia bacterium]